MNSKISKAVAFSNGEIAYISWQIEHMIAGCLGFEITRLYPDTPADNKVLPMWVAFEGQKNRDWQPQNSSVWPVQKLNWRDLTLRKRRDSLERHPDTAKEKPVSIQYLVRPVVEYRQELEEVKPEVEKTYTGAVVRMSYLDQGTKTNIFQLGTQYGQVRATFTNGILATQWLTHVLKEEHATYPTIKKAISDKDSNIRRYLTGDVLDSLKMLLDRAKHTPGAGLKMAIYELDDEELIDLILENKDKVEIVLANSSADKEGHWDDENKPAREKLSVVKQKTDRMFNNSAHIGHNKFVIYLENQKPLAVLTGSTNWTPNGLCAQSNNAVVIGSPELAQLYDAYFENLKEDCRDFVIPQPLSAPTRNAQGKDFRDANKIPLKPVILEDKTEISIWFSPNTTQKTVNKTLTPPDLAQVYSLMRKAQHAIFFAVFLPGLANDASGEVMTNIITESISLAQKDSSLLVYGAISDPMAMPNYEKGVNPVPTTYDHGKLHIVRAASLTAEDLIGDFEAELLSAGHAIIHDKIVVIDPFSDNAIAVFGSHNAGFKASYADDENLLIVKNNPALVQAYAVHVLDIYEHYRTRAVIAELEAQHKKITAGYLEVGDNWLRRDLADKRDLSDYMCNYKDSR